MHIQGLLLCVHYAYRMFAFVFKSFRSERVNARARGRARPSVRSLIPLLSAWPWQERLVFPAAHVLQQIIRLAVSASDWFDSIR